MAGTSPRVWQRRKARALYRYGRMSSVFSRIRSALRSRGHTAFLAASLLLGVLVGIGAAVLVWAMELVGHSVAETETFFGLGKWIFLISIPLGLLAAWLLNKWLGPDVSGGGVEFMRQGKNPLEAGLAVLERVAEQCEDRLRDEQGRPKFGLKFYLVNKDGEYAGVSMWSDAQFAVADADGARLEDCAFLFQRDPE